jgi:hypothetical protein
MRRSTSLLVLLLGLAAAAGCKSVNEKARVHIEYEQVANFYNYILDPLDPSPQSQSAGEGMFVLFKITKIENEGSQAEDFTFDLQKLLTVTPDKTSNDQPFGDDTILLGSKLIGSKTVVAHDTQTNLGYFIKTAHTNDPVAMQAALVDLLHVKSDSQPVSMKRAPGDNSTIQVSDATPQALQGLP